MDDLDPVQAAHMAQGGPAQAAGAWFGAIVDRADLAEAWPLTDGPLRLALAQSWILSAAPEAAVQDRDGTARAIADGPPPGWADFADWRVQRWRDHTFRDFVTEGWGLVSVPEVAGPDVEFVRIAPGRDGRELPAGARVLVQTLTVRLVDNVWLVAGIGRTLAVPGWPPTEETLPTTTRLRRDVRSFLANRVTVFQTVRTERSPAAQRLSVALCRAEGRGRTRSALGPPLVPSSRCWPQAWSLADRSQGR